MKPAQPLMLVHGFTGNANVWNDVQNALHPARTVLAFDLPGHGSQSDVRDDKLFTVDGVCTYLLGKLDLAGAMQADIWGYSMGGRIALHFALAFPDRVNRLILESTSPGIADESERRKRRQSDDDIAALIESEGLESFVDRWMDQPLFASQRLLSKGRQELGRKIRLQTSPAGLANALRGFSVGLQKPLHDRLSALEMPVLIIAGETDAKYRTIGEAMAHSIPGAQLRIIPEAGHAPHWERPVETTAVVEEFLSRA